MYFFFYDCKPLLALLPNTYVVYDYAMCGLSVKKLFSTKSIVSVNIESIFNNVNI